jgi:hypothetical protein
MADIAYYDGFVSLCMQVGNTKLICEIAADSDVLDMRTLLTQTSTATQPREAIQAAQWYYR